MARFGARVNLTEGACFVGERAWEGAGGSKAYLRLAFKVQQSPLAVGVLSL